MTDAKQILFDFPLNDEKQARKTANDDKIGEIGVRFSDDLIVKAGPISMWLWGEWNPRKAYYLAEKGNAYPFFSEGCQLAIRKSAVLAFIAAKERRAFRDDTEEHLVKLAILLTKLLELIRHAQRTGGFGARDGMHVWTALLEETSSRLHRVLKSE